MKPNPHAKPRAFLGVRFINCMCYGRLYRNEKEQAYVGMCPRCAKRYRIRIGTHGTSSRMFAAYC